VGVAAGLALAGVGVVAVVGMVVVAVGEGCGFVVVGFVVVAVGEGVGVVEGLAGSRTMGTGTTSPVRMPRSRWTVSPGSKPAAEARIVYVPGGSKP
jgi:hypothetical protein